MKRPTNDLRVVGGRDAAAVIVEPASLTTTKRTLQESSPRLSCEGDDFHQVINENGYPYCYSCHIAPGSTTNFLRVTYDYELAWEDESNGNGDFARTILPRLEWGILDQVASDLYLRSCQLDRQDSTDSTIVGVSSLYLDFRDIDVKDCQYLTSTSSAEIGPDLACAPAAGSMTAEYIGNPTEVEMVLQEAIATVMTSRRGLGGPVKEILYLGDRATYSRNRGSNFAATTIEEDDQGVLTASIATSVSAIFLLLVLVGAALFVWKRSAETKKREIQIPMTDVEMPAEDNHVNLSPPCDNEQPSSPPPSPPREISKDVVVEEEDKDDEQEADDYSTTPLGDEEQVNSSISNTQKAYIETTEDLMFEPALPPPIKRVPTPTALTTVNSSDSDSTAGADMDMNMLTKDLKSETLKKHRKKKKKKFKKVATLVRVNSRENVASMETISETDEQEQQDDLDEDEAKQTTVPVGTYSTSDEESSSEFSAASSDNEQETEPEAEIFASKSSPTSRNRRNLPPLPRAEF